MGQPRVHGQSTGRPWVVHEFMVRVHGYPMGHPWIAHGSPNGSSCVGPWVVGYIELPTGPRSHSG